MAENPRPRPRRPRRRRRRRRRRAVTALEQSPALDVVAVGFADGVIALLHLKQDVKLFQFRAGAPNISSSGGLGSSSGGVAVTSLSFRTDGGFAKGASQGSTGGVVGGQPPPTLASGMADGRVWVWNLETRSLAGEVGGPLGAHDDMAGGSKGGGAGGGQVGGRGVLSAVFLPKEPVLLTLGADNALRSWIFDQAGGQSVDVGGSSAGCRLLPLARRSRPPAPRPRVVPRRRGEFWSFGFSEFRSFGVRLRHEKND